MQGQTTTLRQMLTGPALNDRDQGDHYVPDIHAHLRGVQDLIPRVYGDSDACKHAAMEIGTIINMYPHRTDCVASKRAMLMCALAAEEGVKKHLAARDDGYARDMAERVLPFIKARFYKHCCQNPESFVLMALLLSEMWQGETLGNWSAHHDSSVGQLEQGGNGKLA